MHFPVLAHVASLLFDPVSPTPVGIPLDCANGGAKVSPHAMVLLLIAWPTLVLSLLFFTAKTSSRRER